MGPKKEKKAKKKKVKEKPPKILKSEYLAKIAERNAVLAAARRRIEKVEDVYYSAEKRYEQTQEDLSEVIKFLEHEIEETELKIAKFDEQISIYKAEITKNDQHYQSKISALETEYEGKEKEFQDQFQQNMAKLSAFEDIRQQREEYFRKKEQIYQKLKEMKARHEKELYDANRLHSTPKEMEYHINKFVTDFWQATDIAIIINTNKIIRDNIALGNKLTCMQEIFEKARDSYYKLYELEKQYRYNVELLVEEHQIAMKKYTKQVDSIEGLLKDQNELCEKIKRSQRLIGENRRLRRQIAEKECKFKEQEEELTYLQKVLREHIEIFNLVKNVFNIWRKNVIDLDICLYESAKRVKHGIDVEESTSLLDESTVSEEMTKEEQEDTLKELKYKSRDNDIEEIIKMLKKRLLSETEMQLPTLSSEFISEHSNMSSTSDIKPERSSSLLQRTLT